MRELLKRLGAAIVKYLSIYPPCDLHGNCWIEYQHPMMMYPPW